jgi:hypothetical protein
MGIVVATVKPASPARGGVPEGGLPSGFGDEEHATDRRLTSRERA